MSTFRIIPNATEHSSDRQLLAVQSNTKRLRDAANQLLQQPRTIMAIPLVTAEAAALTGSTRGLYVADADYRLASAFLFSRGTLTANDMNYATIALHASGTTGTQRRELARSIWCRDET